MDEELEISRGGRAKRLLEDPLLVEALEAIHERYTKAWRNTQLSQVTVREEAYRMLSAVDEFTAHLTRFVQTGKLATTAKETRVVSEDREQRLKDWDGSTDTQPVV